MDINELLDELYSYSMHGIKLGLENIKKICEELGNPQDSYKIIHIAGTNGKGSTATTLETILLEAGYSVGKYTSPHILKFNERIRADREDISDEDIAHYYEEVKKAVENAGVKPTFFEVTTAMMFKYFQDKKVDYVVLETGMGGRFDATNITKAELCMITNVTLDHTEYLGVMDKWLLSKLNTLTKTVDEHLANYRIPESARALQDFVDDMSNWYVRRSRERFWAKGMEQDKINAYMTLYTALVTVSKVAAPMIPFMTEEIYQNLVKSVDASAPESIHLCDYPEVQNELIDEKLEADMDNVLKLVVMGRACRNASNIKNRQPIGQMFVKAGFDLPEFYQEIVADELNVKNVKFTDDVRDFTSYSFKPQLKTVGPKYGKMLGGIKAALDQLDGNAAMDEINETGSLKLDINGQEVTLFKEDLLIDTAQIEGYVSENDNGITVVLDTNLTEELLEEGFVREIISKIQTMRKEAGFEVMDKIKVTYKGSEKAEAVFAANGTQICSEVLAVSAEKAEPAGFVKEWKINGEAVFMGVEKEGR